MAGKSKRGAGRTSTREVGKSAVAGGDPCDLEFTTELTSVRLAALRTIAVGTVLDVQIVRQDSSEAAVCVVRSSSDVVGALAGFEGLAVLIDCIRRGNRYSAEVLRITVATCAVHVRRARV
ncbi:hypothetical protein DY467_10365 [Rhodopseudomonas sp. BR0G17]|nr:hypothetical protein [Rhodopseudomonas sp. BR0G17]